MQQKQTPGIPSVYCEHEESSARTGVGLARPTTAMAAREKKKLARVKNCMCTVSLVESGEGFSDFLSSQLPAFIAPQQLNEDRLRFSVLYTVVYGHSCRIFELLVADR